MALNLNELNISVNELQKDMAQVGALVERLDITIEKLTEVSATVSQLLAVHGSRLEVQEKVQERLQDLVEKRKSETDEAINKVYLRIEDGEDKLQKDAKESNENILNELRIMRDENKTQHEEYNKRMTELEKWMWTLGGGAVVVGTALTIIVALFA